MITAQPCANDLPHLYVVSFYSEIYMMLAPVRNPTGISMTTEALTGVPRSKSARKRQKLSMPKSTIECDQDWPPCSTCSKFFVPAYGQHGDGGYQDQKYFGLIEGMGGGEGKNSCSK